MITLWGRPNSINVQKVLWTLGELGLAFEHVDAGGDAGGLDDPAFRARNPHGRVPVLRDGDVAIWESNTIVRYLFAAYGDETACPRQPLARAPVEAWMDWTLATLQPAIMGYFWSYYRTPAALRNAQLNARFAADATSALKVLDAWLASRPFVVGGAFTMADLPAGTLMFRYFNIEVDRPVVPAVERWRARLAERAPYRTHVMRPFAELFGRQRD
ncbi:MAG TPA: glutathione S-transferase N-terminal domain-containing protein [Caulobacteraceae bacterium]|nr:glutathione S-transferase N-terminal domain-containing protein [Caulobacteraceae bacterium]